MAADYHPELDESPSLGEIDHAKFQSLVGCANWLVTLKRFDIVYAVNAYSRYTIISHQGHYNGIKRVFGYLKKFKKAKAKEAKRLKDPFAALATETTVQDLMTALAAPLEARPAAQRTLGPSGGVESRPGPRAATREHQKRCFALSSAELATGGSHAHWLFGEESCSRVPHPTCRSPFLTTATSAIAAT